MRIVSRLTGAIGALLRRHRTERDLDDELRGFFAASVEAKLAAGMSRADAERAARIELGSPAAVKDWTRDVGWESRIESAWQDVRYAARTLRRSPGLASAAIGTLAVGIGVTAAMYAIVDAVLLTPLPYAEPERVVGLRFTDPANGIWGVAPGAVAAVRDLPSVEFAAGSAGAERAVLAPDASVLVSGEATTEEFFQVFGVPAALGRTFNSEDLNAGPVVVLSDRLWRRAFAARTDVIGQFVSMSGVPHRILGVMPPIFTFRAGDDAQFWLLRPFPAAERADVGSGPYHVVVRLRTGNLPVARAQLAGLPIEARTPSGEKLALAFVPILDTLSEFYGSILWSLLGAVAVVLLLACGNVANLLLARGRQRGPEFAIRQAIGASRGRILRQVLTESAVLGAAAVVLAAVVAWLLLQTVPLLPFGTLNVARIDEVALNGRVVGLLLASAVGTVLVFGLIPAVTASRHVGAGAHTRSVTRPHGRAAQALIALEITATVTLLAGSALVASRIADLMTTEFGFDIERLQMASLRPIGSEYRGRELARVYDDVVTRLRERTGMQAALIDRMPLDYWRAQPVQVNRDMESVRAGVRAMSTGAIAVAGAELVAGREFRDSDRDGAPRVAVINESLAARLPGGGQSAVGTTVSVTWRAEQHELQIVGVVRDLRDSVYRPAGPEIYVSAAQFPQTRATFIVRSDRSPEEVGTALQQALRDVDPRQAISDVVMLSDRVRTYTALSRFVGILLGVFAGLAILLAATGILAAVAGAVASRTRELGIRIAVGASRRDLLTSLSRDFVPPFLTGVAAGALATWGASNVLRSLVPGVELVDPAAFAAASAGLIAVAVAGAWGPVRRALAIDPVIVLAAPEEW